MCQEKFLIHNYGHGGGGMSLSWGSALLALNLAPLMAGRDCAVVGAGVMGLSLGRLLQSRGAKVTIYAKNLPPETTSNVSGAQWWPFSVFDNSRRTEAFSAQYVAAARFSYEYFQQFAGPEWGVSWLPNYYLSDTAPSNGWLGGPGGVLHGMQVDFRDFAPGEHAFSQGYARRFYSMFIEPATYLAKLTETFRTAGGAVMIRSFADAAEVLALPQPVIFNCTGLGAGALFGDLEMIPIKGQLTFLLPQPAVKYNLISGDFICSREPMASCSAAPTNAASGIRHPMRQQKPEFCRPTAPCSRGWRRFKRRAGPDGSTTAWVQALGGDAAGRSFSAAEPGDLLMMSLNSPSPMGARSGGVGGSGLHRETGRGSLAG